MKNQVRPPSWNGSRAFYYYVFVMFFHCSVPIKTSCDEDRSAAQELESAAAIQAEVVCLTRRIDYYPIVVSPRSVWVYILPALGSRATCRCNCSRRRTVACEVSLRQTVMVACPVPGGHNRKLPPLPTPEVVFLIRCFDYYPIALNQSLGVRHPGFRAAK